MNMIAVDGVIINDAEKTLIRDGNEEIPLVTFTLCDTGLPYQKCKPLLLEITFMKENAMAMFKYLKKDKSVIVYGYLKQKEFKNRIGENKYKYIVSADFIKFPAKIKTGVTM